MSGKFRVATTHRTQGILGNSKKLLETQGIFAFLENTQGNSWKFAVVANNM